MKTLLINMALRPESPIKMFPVGLGYIATALKNAEIEFDILDLELIRYDLELMQGFQKYDVVLLGTIVTGYKYVKRLCALIREENPNAVIVVGNTVASSIPEILLSKTEADVAVIGEGDVTVVELLKNLKGWWGWEGPGIMWKDRGKIRSWPNRKPIPNLDLLPFIDFELWDIEAYIRNTPLQVSEPCPIPRDEVRALPINTARGCPCRCGFCYNAFQGYPYRRRSIGDVLTEARGLKWKYGLNFIGFSDELTFADKDYAKKFSEEILDLELAFYWVAQCRAGTFGPRDGALVDLMKAAGCVGASFALESADRGILLSMRKGITVKAFEEQVTLFHQHDLSVWTSLVLGYPQETPATIKETFDVCARNGVYPSIGYLLPQPGTPIYEYARKIGRIQDEEEYLLGMGDRQDLYLNLTTMSDDEFREFVMAGAARCRDAVGVDLPDDKLVKTGHYVGFKEKEISRLNKESCVDRRYIDRLKSGGTFVC